MLILPPDPNDPIWTRARDIMLEALAFAGVQPVVRDGYPHFHETRLDLWRRETREMFAGALSGILGCRVIWDEMFGPHSTLDIVIGHVEELLLVRTGMVTRSAYAPDGGPVA